MMRCASRAVSLAALIGMLAAMTACTTPMGGSSNTSFSSDVVRPSLEVPPDLVTPGKDDRYALPKSPAAASLSTYDKERVTNKVATEVMLPQSKGGMYIDRSGTARWLVVTGTPEKLWPELRAFWMDVGFGLVVDNPELGQMQTTWAENRANIPMDYLRKWLGKVGDNIYDSGIRDRFVVRMERSREPGKVDIFIVNHSAEEVYVDAIQTRWVMRPSNPLLESEMLYRLMGRLAGDNQIQAKASEMAAKPLPVPDKARVIDANNNVALQLDLNFDSAWRQVGVSLDRLGLVVEDRDRTKGTYGVRYLVADAMLPEAGAASVWDKMAFWKSDTPNNQTAQYLILVKSASETQTMVTVLDKAGVPLSSKSARTILDLLQNQLK